MNRKNKAFLFWIFCFTLLHSGESFSDGGYFQYASETEEYADFDSQRAVFVINEDGSYSLYIQTNYTGKPAGFSWVLPLPNLPDNYEETEQEFLNAMDKFTAPRFFRDPCLRHYCSHGGEYAAGSGGEGEHVGDAITVWTSQEIGILDTAVLSGGTAQELINWLNERGFQIPSEADSIISEYISEGFYFFVAKIDLQDVPPNEEVSNLSPIRFDFPAGTRVVYPMKLTSISKVDVIPVLLFVVDKSNKIWAPSTYSYEINEDRNMDMEQYSAYMDSVFNLAGSPTLLVQYFGCLAESCYGEYLHTADWWYIFIPGRAITYEDSDYNSRVFRNLISNTITSAVRYYGRVRTVDMNEDIIFTVIDQQEKRDEFKNSVNDFLQLCESYTYIDDCPAPHSEFSSEVSSADGGGCGCTIVGLCGY